MSEDKKKCRVCKELLELDKFGNSSSAKDGKQSRCKACALEYRRRRRREGNPPPGETRGIARRDKTQSAAGDIWWPNFLESLSNHGIVTRASEEANIGVARVWREHKNNPKFAALFDEARSIGLRRCIDEAVRRGADGFDEPIYQGGELVGYKKKYSDQLLQFVIQANFDKYKNRNELTVEGGKNPLKNETVLSLDTLDLPLSVRKQILEAVEKKEQEDSDSGDD